MARTSIPVWNPAPQQARLWQIAQVSGLVLTVVLLVGLTARPEISLRLLWDVAIPILPAVFLINPLIWRNVCPLATINKLTGDRVGSATLPTSWVGPATAVGVGLLFVLVPARRFVFNTDGTLLALTIAVVAVLALASGLVYSAKAGFCNSICPVLAVERLYGQRPFVDVPNARCEPCNLCTSRGCIDLAPRKSVAQTVGPRRRTARWIATPYGVFAAAFPGFVYAYFTAVDGPLSSAPGVYGHFLFWCAISYAVFAVVTLSGLLRNEQLVLLLGAVAIGLYYWYASPTIAEGFALPAAAAVPLRALALGLILVWAWRALVREKAAV